MPRPGSAAERERLIAFLAACSLFLSAIEFMIPKPLPFMRLGIANLPLILATELLGPLPYLLLAALKTVGQNLVSGTLFSYVFLFSIAGTMASAAAMYGARRAGGRRISLVGVSVLGAFVSAASQNALGVAFIFGQAAWIIAPPFLASGLVTGLLMGLACERFAGNSAFLALARDRLGLPPRGAAG